MSSTDPSEQNKHKWSPLSAFKKGRDPPPQPDVSGGAAAMVPDKDQPVYLKPQPYSMFVDRDQSLPVEMNAYAPQTTWHTGRYEPLLYLPPASGSTDAQPPALTYPPTSPPLQPIDGHDGYPSSYQPTTQSSSMMNIDRDRPLDQTVQESMLKVQECMLVQESMLVDRDRPLDYTSSAIEEQVVQESMLVDHDRPLDYTSSAIEERVVQESTTTTTTVEEIMLVDRDRPLDYTSWATVEQGVQEIMLVNHDRPLDFISTTVEDLAISSSADSHQMQPSREPPLPTVTARITETKEAGAQAESAIVDDEHPDMDPETAAAVAAIRAMQNQGHNPFDYHNLMTVHRDHVLPLPSKSKERIEDQEVPLLVPVSPPVTPVKQTSISALTPPKSSTSSRLSNAGEGKKAKTSASLHVDRNTPLTPLRTETSAMNMDRDTPLPFPSQPIATPPQSTQEAMRVDRDTPLPQPRPHQSYPGQMHVERDTPLPVTNAPAMHVDRDTPLPQSRPQQSYPGQMHVERDTPLPVMNAPAMHVDRDTPLPQSRPQQSYPGQMHVERDTPLPVMNAPAMNVDRDTPLPATGTPATSTGWPVLQTNPFPTGYGFPNFKFGAGGNKSEINTAITPTTGQDIPLEERGGSSNSGGVGAAPVGYNPMMYPVHLMNTLQQHPPYMGPITYPQPVFVDKNQPWVVPDSSNTAQPMMPTPLVLPTSQKNVYGPPDRIGGKTSDVYRWRLTRSQSSHSWQPLTFFRGGNHYECTLNIATVEAGWHWVVLHLEPSQFLQRDMIESLVIDVKQMDAIGKEVYMSKTCKTELTDFDFGGLFASRSDVPIRLRLHRQIELRDGVELQLTIDSMIQSAAWDHLKVNFVDIVKGQPDNNDLVVYGEGRPHEVIHIPQHHAHGTSTRTTNVHSCSMSDMRNHAVTLSFADEKAYIHVWDLSSSGPDGVSSVVQDENLRSPQHHKAPFAQISFEAKAANHEEIKDICLGISNSGMQVSIHSIERDHGQGIPFKLFQYAPKVAADHDMSSPWSLGRVDSLAPGLKDFYGYGCFHSRDEDDIHTKERYITCDGLQVRVYNTSTQKRKWQLYFTLPLCLEQNLDAALRLYASLHARYFAWTGSKDVVSIWDVETGRHVSYIATLTEDNAEVFVNFSKSGKKVAISVSGKIRIHQTHSGVLLGEYTQGLNEDSYYEVDFDEDYFMAIDQTASTAAKERQESLTSCRRIVDTTSDMAIQRTFWIHRDYRLLGVSGTRPPLFGFGQGSVYNFLPMPDPIAPAPSYSDHPGCDLRGIVVDRYVSIASLGFLSNAGDSFQVSSSQRAVRGIWSTVLEISRSTDFTKSVILPLGPAMSIYHGVFVAETSHLVLVVGCFLQRWKLLASGPEICALELIWKIQDDSKHLKDICIREIMSAGVCRQGQEVILQLAPPQWFRRYRRIEDEDEEDGDEKNDQKPKQPKQSTPEIATVPLSQHDTVTLPLEDREIQGVVGAVTLYTEGDAVLKRYVIQYLKSLVRLSQEHYISCIVSLARVWTPDRRVSVEGILNELLSSKRITWVPDTFATKESDPLSILMEIAQRQPSAIGASRILLDYCVNHAIDSRNLSFLSPLFLSLHSLMNLFPEEASEYLSKIAFIPAQQRSFIIDNHQVARPPRPFRIPFWKTSSVPLYKVEDPILQLVVTPPKEKDAANDTFTRPVFMTSFDALWSYMDEKTRSIAEGVNSDAPSNILRAATVYSPVVNVPNALPQDDDDDSSTSEDGLGRKRTNWFKTWLHMVRYKSQFRTTTFVKSHDFNLEFFDNPAIAALVAYKWNTIGYSYWFFRFMSQCIFYFLVFFAAVFQVYDRNNPNPTIGHFVAILVLGAIFLWLELLQALRSWHRYKKSSYNMLDLVAYGLPMIASIDEIVIHQMGIFHGNTRILSFSVLVVFLHMLFEARVNEGVCKYVTIIQEAILEIKVFLVIFAAGLFGFAVAILHLLHGGYPTGDYVDGGPYADNNTFPMNFAGALSATYFFMGGIYDPISANFDGEDWAFHIMMALFFFFTVILMLNVLIALINVAFIKGGDGWRLVWIESRLQYIESAENMSYHLPGFRDAHDEYFPKVIYFTATWKDVKDYKQKYKEVKLEGAAAAEATKQLNGLDTSNVVAHSHSPACATGAPETPGGGALHGHGGGAPDATLTSILAQLEALKLIILETQRASNVGAAAENTPKI